MVFEQLKLCHLKRIAFRRFWRWSFSKHPLKILAWSVDPFKVCRRLRSLIQRNTRNWFFFWVVYCANKKLNNQHNIKIPLPSWTNNRDVITIIVLLHSFIDLNACFVLRNKQDPGNTIFYSNRYFSYHKKLLTPDVAFYFLDETRYSVLINHFDLVAWYSKILALS